MAPGGMIVDEIRSIVIVMQEAMVAKALASLIEQEFGVRMAKNGVNYEGGQISCRRQLIASEIEKPRSTLLVLHSELWNDPAKVNEIDKLAFSGVRCVQISNRAHSTQPDMIIRNKHISGFVDTSDSSESLIEAIVFAGQREPYLSKTRKKFIPENSTYLLSPQERRALSYVCYSVKAAANALGCGEKTVHTYFKRVRKKLNIATTPHLIGWCLSNGVATLPLRAEEFEEDLENADN